MKNKRSFLAKVIIFLVVLGMLAPIVLRLFM